METQTEVIQRYVDAFNRGDLEAMAAAFGSPATILDGMAPHIWHGPNAPRDWFKAALVEGEQHSVSDYLITLGKPLHDNVTQDDAYVVVPASFSYKVRGQPVLQKGAFLTVVLHRSAEGWRMKAWAWTKGVFQ